MIQALQQSWTEPWMLWFHFINIFAMFGHVLECTKITFQEVPGPDMA
jgi:hypothetical protein